jgi:uncharacterized protein
VSISMHQSSVGVFSHFLDSLSDLLDRAAAHAETRKIDPSILLSARLFPNMYNLTRQVGEANRHAVLACALLAGIDPPVFPETEPDIAELKARIAVAKKFMGNIPPAQIDGTEEKEVVFTFKNGSTRKFTGRWLLLSFSVPQFFFHVTTAYAIAALSLSRRTSWESHQFSYRTGVPFANANSWRGPAASTVADVVA